MYCAAPSFKQMVSILDIDDVDGARCGVPGRWRFGSRQRRARSRPNSPGRGDAPPCGALSRGHDRARRTPPHRLLRRGLPLCAAEIRLYRRAEGSWRIAWVDVSTEGPADLGSGLTRSAARARFHVRRPDGALVSGAAGSPPYGRCCRAGAFWPASRAFRRDGPRRGRLSAVPAAAGLDRPVGSGKRRALRQGLRLEHFQARWMPARVKKVRSHNP